MWAAVLRKPHNLTHFASISKDQTFTIYDCADIFDSFYLCTSFKSLKSNLLNCFFSRECKIPRPTNSFCVNNKREKLMQILPNKTHTRNTKLFSQMKLNFRRPNCICSATFYTHLFEINYLYARVH